MKKLIGLFALVAVVSLVGCGSGNGSGDQGNKDEQKKAARPDGTYTVTSYVCSDGVTMPLSKKNQVMKISANADEVVLTNTFESAGGDAVTTNTYTMNVSFSDTEMKATSAKSYKNVVDPRNGNVRFDGEPYSDLVRASLKDMVATYTVKNNELGLTIADDHFCGGKGQTGTITAQK